jgi:hypothetical protein
VKLIFLRDCPDGLAGTSKVFEGATEEQGFWLLSVGNARRHTIEDDVKNKDASKQATPVSGKATTPITRK